MGILMVHSPELGRQRGGRATVVRAAAVGTPVRSALRLGEWEMGSGDGCGEEGQAPHPFIGSEGGVGRLDGERDRATGGGSINAGRPVRWGGETGGWGEWGVKRGECGAVSGRGGVIGAVAAPPGRASGGRRRSGRMIGWAAYQWGGGGGAGWAEREGREMGHSWSRKEGREVGRGWAKIVARAEIQGSKRKSIFN
jgi:hypothetical protein